MPDIDWSKSVYSDIWEILGDEIEQFFKDMEQYKIDCAKELLANTEG